MIVVNAKIKQNVKNFIFTSKIYAKIIKMETANTTICVNFHIFKKKRFYFLIIQNNYFYKLYLLKAIIYGKVTIKI